MQVEIWSDVVCPWCYIGKRRFETALARFEHRADVEVTWRAFELDATATSVLAGEPRVDGALAASLAAKHGTGVEQAQGMLDSTTAAAAGEGLEFHFERSVAANTAAAHQVIHLAGERGLQEPVKERLMRAHFVEGEAVGDHEVLVRLAVEAGLDAEEVRAVLAGDTLLDAVRAEEAEAQALGVRGVPFFVIDRTYGVSGAQPPEALLEVLERAWAESRPPQVLTPAGGAAADGDACGPDGCAI